MQIKAIVVVIIMAAMMMADTVIAMVVMMIAIVAVQDYGQRRTFSGMILHIIRCQRQYRRRQHKKYGDFGNQFHEIPHSVKIQYTPIQTADQIE